MPRDFEGKVALVTGAAAGIGRACAVEFAMRGAQVVVSDVNADGGKDTVRLVEAANGQAEFVRCDVSDNGQVQGMIQATLERFHRLDFACNNAGIEGASATIADYPIDVWERVISINLTGAMLCMKYEIPVMLNQGGGAIVNMASILGSVGFPNASAYVAAKHGIIGLTQTAALEYAAQRVRINVVCPGFIATEMLTRGGMTEGNELFQMLVNMHPIRRLGKPEEVANTVMFLCSDAAGFMNGASVFVDGGYVAQ